MNILKEIYMFPCEEMLLLGQKLSGNKMKTHSINTTYFSCICFYVYAKQELATLIIGLYTISPTAMFKVVNNNMLPNFFLPNILYLCMCIKLSYVSICASTCM